jgi:hypothetical protein
MPLFPERSKRLIAYGDTMQDMKAHLEKLQVQIAECEIVRDLATDPKKRDLFGRLAEHHKVLAAQVEKAIAAHTPVTFLGRKTQEPFPKEEE